MGRPKKEVSEENEEVIIPEVVEEFPVLQFIRSGWCEELKRSYRQGVYKPKTKEEYNALKKYALKEAK